ncbi:MAG: metallophosphoesterase [Clostridia bacterium]|nr:metallophosphoesterase [Clostridia bacterium]
MKIGLFSDPHYCKVSCIGETRMPAISYEKIKEAMTYFKEQSVDICFCLGDLTDSPDGVTRADAIKNLDEILELIHSFEIPFYVVPGNHDYLTLKREDLARAGIKTPPYIVEDEYNFIILDANYRSSMEHFDTAGVDWTDSNLPKEQVDFLEKALKESDKQAIVMVHENLDPSLEESHIIKNAIEIREIIKNSGKVKMVIQGHFHRGNEIIVDDIPYFTVRGMCERNANPFFIKEI